MCKGHCHAASDCKMRTGAAASGQSGEIPSEAESSGERGDDDARHDVAAIAARHPFSPREDG